KYYLTFKAPYNLWLLGAFMHAQSAGEPKRSDLRLLGAFMHAQSAGEPKRSDLRLLGAFMHAQKRRRTENRLTQ
ncbi:hypothetical protein LOR75_13320, partial [Staphylococcus aureus]